LPARCTLGDVVGTIYLLENIGRQLDLSIGLKGHVSHILPVYKLRYVTTYKQGNLLNNFKKTTPHYLVNLVQLLKSKFVTVNWNNFAPLEPSKPSPPVEKDVAVQFDSRSAPRLKRVLADPRWAIQSLVRHRTVAAIGGPDTQDYLKGFTYDLHFLPELAFRLMEYQLFIGCDSGISHLAGSLRIKSIIIPLDDHQLLKNMYSLYSNTTTLPNSAFKCGIVL